MGWVSITEVFKLKIRMKPGTKMPLALPGARSEVGKESAFNIQL